jgi:hypothetical protein
MLIRSQILVRFQERAQQGLEHGRVDGLRAQVFVDQQVQARHVNAATIRTGEIDEGTDLGARALYVAVAGVEAYGHLDAVHPHPIQRASQMRLRLGGDIGHQANGVFVRMHGVFL